jgi:hypothetical protein
MERNFTTSLDCLTQMMNEGKEMFIANMVKEGIIDQATADQMNKHAIVVSNKKFWGKVYSKLFSDDESTVLITVVKIIP